jgi:hypothetical protein
VTAALGAVHPISMRTAATDDDKPDKASTSGVRSPQGRLRQLGCNKIDGMARCCHKVSLSLALNLVAELDEDLVPWWPTTFVLPRDMQEATTAISKRQKDGQPTRTFIYKPDSTFGGAGVVLAQTMEALQDLVQRKGSQGCAVLQEYLPRPLLMDGLKWDARVYVLVTSVSPLRVYVAREGLARFCTELYRKPSAANLDAVFAHLTNSTLNKNSASYQSSRDDPSGGRGSKRALSVVLRRIEAASQHFTVAGFWAQIEKIVAVTLVSMQPELLRRRLEHEQLDIEKAAIDGGAPPSSARWSGQQLQQQAQAQFHLLGFDVLLDSYERPSLLEVNAAPSLAVEQCVDSLPACCSPAAQSRVNDDDANPGRNGRVQGGLQRHDGASRGEELRGGPAHQDGAGGRRRGRASRGGSAAPGGRTSTRRCRGGEHRCRAGRRRRRHCPARPGGASCCSGRWRRWRWWGCCQRRSGAAECGGGAV